jgi:GTPase SAR1 family protein
MEVVKQKNNFNVQNYDNVASSGHTKKEFRRNGDLLPDNLRCLIIGPSGVGKTNLLLTLLLHPEGLRYRQLYLYTKSPEQQKMKYLTNVMNTVPEIEFTMETNDENVIAVENLPKYSTVVFDDFLRQEQTCISDIFLRCRHYQCDCLYLTQSLSRVNRQLIRNNINILFIFTTDELTLSTIFKEYAIFDFDNFSEFQKLCKLAFAEKYNFLTIDLTRDKNKGRYRINLDNFVTFKN